MGFVIIYLGRLNLNTATIFQAQLVEIFILGTQDKSFIEFIYVYFKPVFYLISALLFFCFGLSFLAVKNLKNIKYFLIFTILPIGILFNFSILFFLFSFGLYAASLYSTHFGEIYKEEIKKWRNFRVGSGAVGKALYIMFLFVFLGSIITFSIDNTYRYNFINTTIGGLKNVTISEIKNFEIQGANVEEKSSNLTEITYPKNENWSKDTRNYTVITPETINGIVESTFKNSLIRMSLSYWFPFFISFTIWFLLEFLRCILLSPISGLFSIFIFKLEENIKFSK